MYLRQTRTLRRMFNLYFEYVFFPQIQMKYFYITFACMYYLKVSFREDKWQC